jgi:hypothetical protein
VRSLVIALVLAFGTVAPAAAADEAPRKPEVLRERPSGFWTSNRPAQGGAYRWRLLGIGEVLVGVTGLLMWRHVRRANAERSEPLAKASLETAARRRPRRS